MPRCNLGPGALALALLAGCLSPTDDTLPADPSVEPPAQPPAKQPEQPAPPPPELIPPAPPPANVSGDEYDPAHHRVLYGDCAAGTLMSADLASGERRVVADTWPWSEPEARVCVDSLVVAPGGENVYAVVDRTFTAPDGAGEVSCTAADLVAIETATGKTSSLWNLHQCCGVACEPSLDIDALQIDATHGRLLHLETGCGEAGCESRLTSTSLSDGAEDVSHIVSTEDSGSARELAFDPAAPHRQVLVLLDDGSIDRVDFVTGARAKVAAIQNDWEDEIDIRYTTGMTVDPEGERMFVAAVALWPGPDALFVIVEVDLASGEQSLLYDGSPTDEGTVIACHPEPSFDTLENRILMVEPVDSSGCAGRVFAVDASTGELTLVDGATP